MPTYLLRLRCKVVSPRKQGESSYWSPILVTDIGHRLLYFLGPTPMMGRPPVLPRPVLQADRGVFDRLAEYLVGDGPSNRYALICRRCHRHNGMALKEEFEYLAFHCAYCQFLNPAK